MVKKSICHEKSRGCDAFQCSTGNLGIADSEKKTAIRFLLVLFITSFCTLMLDNSRCRKRAFSQFYAVLE